MSKVTAQPVDVNKKPDVLPAGATIAWKLSDASLGTLAPIPGDPLSMTFLQTADGTEVFSAAAMNADGTPVLGPDGTTPVAGSLSVPLPPLPAGAPAALVVTFTP